MYRKPMLSFAVFRTLNGSSRDPVFGRRGWCLFTAHVGELGGDAEPIFSVTGEVMWVR